MASIYSNSYLTIAAARASDSSEGFLGPRKIKKMQKVSFEDGVGSFRLYFYPYDVSFSPGSTESTSLEPLKVRMPIVRKHFNCRSIITGAQNEPVAKRAWTLQERLLPIRTLHFGADQMYWECAQTSQCEDGESFGAGDEDFRLDAIVRGLLDIRANRLAWFKLVEAYTSRNLTYLSDKLPALAGVVDAIRRQTGDDYYAGLWKNHFLEGLLWRIEDPDLDLYVSKPTPPRKLDFWRAPSWSFFAVEGVIRYQELLSFETKYCAELEECSITSAGRNPFGECKDGFARIRGPVTTVEVTGQDRTSEGIQCSLQLRHGFVNAKVRFDFEVLQMFEALMITPHTGLAIKPLDRAKNDYVRVGTVQIWKNPGDLVLSTSQYLEPISVVLR